MRSLFGDFNLAPRSCVFFILNSTEHEIYPAHEMPTMSRKMTGFADLNLKIPLFECFWLFQ